MAKQRMRQIAEELGLHINTVHKYASERNHQKYLAYEKAPETRKRARKSNDKYQKRVRGLAAEEARRLPEVAQEQMAAKAPSVRLVLSNDGGKWGWYLRPLPGSSEASQ